ncbi:MULTISPECIES: sulfite exporter TauE/SafE family protein [Pseudomonas]|uniref:sulfite exporter TauE/SafE family protein n=1 Tax=Pseudomonas TaxID=286 RepID=UPI000641968B|nr:sulfite exporter TauE/SafE family protein [Pseudomonas lundensis]NLU02480.1 sulfite exporter TauE/SafE family protein [Pseudomonas lundensis]NNA03551.1 sulfite exporter TauE/SafE family protein [Pseudomonas lundensis]NNA32145.1 sulfite exporter TauE/SafE family protein [Pseudomonas lundensis]NNA41581.1 sulfite exporter TauE/SafE family protein [Pseudomonas lundensis]OZY50797.1 anion permease [Pseudomonas lundensis]
MLMDVVMYTALGVALGAMGGLFGIGGGLIAIPVLGLWFGLDQQMAQGTALVMSVPNVLVALYRYNQRNRIDLRQALPLVVMSFCFAWLGAMLAVGLDQRIIRWGFVGFLLAITLYNLIKLYGAAAQAPTGSRYGWPWFGALGALAGTTGGLFGVGGAVVAAPVLTSVFGTSQVVAQGMSLALAAPSTSVTLLTYAIHHEVNWLMGVPMAIGGLLSISWGVKVAHALPERVLRALYCGFLLVCAGLLAIKA